MKIDDNFYMKLAIDEAWKFQLLTYPNPAVGCVVVKAGKLLAIEAHKEAGLSHAEVNALKTAFLTQEPNSLLKVLEKSSEIHDFLIKNHNGFFEDCEIYTTLEPCNHHGKTPSCAKLLSILKPKRLIIGLIDTNKIASGGIKTLESENIDVTTKVLEKECENLLLPFKSWQNKTSIFFKMAQTLNGSIDGQISSQRAKLYVHTLRDKIDLLMIGGNSVRVDKPILDTRYVKGREPDVFIYSKNKAFSQAIPLFKVPNRKVIISDDLFKLLDYKFVMVEGVYTLLDILKDKLDFVVLIISPKIRNGVNSVNELNIDFEILHENYLGDEKIVFLKRRA
ncbi:riboflavin biosynthesis protein RibD [Aliarcobacter trophiarum LMG 25534]|uniref:Riboflavin biosynthesis protein RibD n=1 Tax=Aliarcobacter trophiarum LMG 25534 TaxID=1032241 RepID=A0AAD0VNA0_9BACT|nr:bifunctional diaminohydroxyphosphoribosylaminopyrimidine deaminase/5-amino-6-(5-phosphoribosylamino)uracil reductase RibD [Aliarcobacter trophiarum]AXK49575.1 diaminohydroxyphosphoribosylaminopyrimidine deaminase / 5-amino-6-(5-phosphoribosylamino)uracil reductase [Aliarcobacter trophiarum LMG 25534]RXI27500.1 riboflavin biosynthesis protein RibD [Aliarcobacter trophiarum]RXJ92251.1 riboflavin biosynthesis protein RibD [Aliarcobacter trophiarum LMG 25534]